MPATAIRSSLGAALALSMLSLTPAAQASRAIVLNGFSAEGIGLAGADVATTRDSAAVNINPAALSQIENRAFDISIYPYYGLIKHSDSVGNDDKLDMPAGAIGNISYARRLQSHPQLVYGTGVFLQGGTGLSYGSLKTQYGTQDELSSNFGVLTLFNGLSWTANDKLSLGAAIGLSYGWARQKNFYETSDNSDPTNPFFGLRFDGGQALVPNVHLGLRYAPSPVWTLALSYISQTKLPLTGGTATFNYDAIGLGHVKYQNARIDGFGLPQELDIGIAYRPNQRWLLAAEINWLDFSSALKSTRLRAKNPENSALPEPLLSIDGTSPLNWNDQYVFALGGAYELDERNTLRAGVNLQNNPIPAEGLSPVLNLMQTRMITFGYGRKFAQGWTFDMGIELQLPVSKSYQNTTLPLGETNKESYADVSGIFAISRRW